jgi:hypothetical protein
MSVSLAASSFCTRISLKSQERANQVGIIAAGPSLRSG